MQHMCESSKIAKELREEALKQEQQSRGWSRHGGTGSQT